ncbi:MAG: AAA family ATPase [Candidatus Harrisonbacteria bacterium]|nr:AAA family ATPase [Candidatus Harrisonbacteria bacterium]
MAEVPTTKQSHPITDADLEKWTSIAEKHLKSVKGKDDIEDVFRQLSPKETYRTLPEELALVYILRQATCLYLYFFDLLMDRTGQRRAVEEAKNQGIPITPAIQTKAKFISAYSFFVMASYIVARCEKELRKKNNPQVAQLDTNNCELVVGKGVSIDLTWALSYYTDALRVTTTGGVSLIQNTGDLLAVTRDYWKAVSVKAVAAVNETPAELLAPVNHTTFHLGSFAVTGLKVDDRKEIQIMSWAPVQPNEVVGDPDVTIMMRRLCDRLALYDPMLQKNPISDFGGLIESILVDGPPGTGKTIRQRMMMTHLAMRAEQMATPYNFKSISADQIKSEWYGKTAQLIAQLLEVVKDPATLTLLFVDDIDLLLSGNRDTAGTSGADMDIMKALMDFFAGTGTNYIGNYIAVAATNKPTATDDALRQRFVYRAIIQGPQSTEDYTDLVAHELRNFKKTGLLEVSQGEYVPMSRPAPDKIASLFSPEIQKMYKGKKGGTWENIGKLCAELRARDPKFTGRPVKNAIQVAIAQASDFEIPEEWFTNPSAFRTRSWDERTELVKKLYQPLTAELIMTALEQQFEVERRYRDESYKKNVETMADQMRVQLQAQKVALNGEK